jgi:hypothetical protein
MHWGSLTPNEQEMYRELSKKIDSVKFYVVLLSLLMGCVIWKIW